jgi:hypothetical protein
VKNPGGAPIVAYAYAESADGINWTRPPLGLVEINGSRQSH